MITLSQITTDLEVQSMATTRSLITSKTNQPNGKKEIMMTQDISRNVTKLSSTGRDIDLLFKTKKQPQISKTRDIT